MTNQKEKFWRDDETNEEVSEREQRVENSWTNGKI